MATVSCHKFTGVDTYTDAGDLPPGGVVYAYNLYVEGGDFKSRPGINGLLTTPLPNPIYSPYPYVKSDQTEWVIFCSGPASSTTGGKIYQVPAAGGTPTEILDGSNGNASFNINAEAFRIALGGGYAYMVWGASLYRTNLSASVASAVSSLNSPVVAPTAALSNIPLDTLLSTTGWSSDTLASASTYMTTSQALINATATGNVTPGTNLGGTPPNTWTAIGATPSVFPADATHAIPTTYASLTDPYATACTKWFALDDAGGGFQTGLLTVGALSAPEAYRSTTQFYFRCFWYTSDTRSLQALKIICNAYNGSSALIATQSFQQVLQYSGQTPGQIIEKVFNFAGLGTSIAFVQFQVVGGDSNVNASVFPNFQGFTFSAGFYMIALSTTAQITFAEVPTGGVSLTHVEPSSAYWGALGGIYATKDYGGSLQNWSAAPVITFNLSSAPGGAFTVSQLVAMGLQMNLILRQSGSTTEYIAPLTFASDGSYMTVNLSAYIPVTIYAAFEYLSLQFVTSLTTTAATTVLFTITSITQAGNLSVSTGSVPFAPVTYVVEELNNFGDAQYLDPLESSGGPISNAVQPTAQFAVGQITVPLPVNTATTGYAIFRGGGAYSDGLLRLIATVPVGSDYNAPYGYSDLVIGSAGNTNKVSSVKRPFVGGDVGLVLYELAGTGFNVGPLTVSSVAGGIATLSGSAGVALSTGGIAQLGGDPLLRDLQNPYVTWNHTTRTLTDNTPDSFLNLALTYQYGRQQPPANCSGVVYHQNRIGVSSGQTLSMSWSLTLDVQNGVYFTTVDLSTDPYAPTKGFTQAINYGDNDNIQSMLSAGSSLLVNKSRMSAVLDGYDPTNFALQNYLVAAGLGNVAPKGAAVCGNTAKVWFVGPDNVYQFDGDDTDPKSVPIQAQLHPNGYDGTPTISTTAFGKCAMMYYDMRLHVFAPVAGGTQNSVDYVYDFRNGAWTIWGLAMTGGASLTGSSSSTLGAFMGGYDGQLYTFAAGGDKATPASSPVGIACTFTSRGMGQEQQAFSPSGEVGMNFLEVSEPSRVYLMGKVPANTVVTMFCYSDDNQAAQFSEQYTVSGRFVAQKYVRGVQGLQIFAGASFTVLTQATIRAVGVEIDKRKAPR